MNWHYGFSYAPHSFVSLDCWLIAFKVELILTTQAINSGINIGMLCLPLQRKIGSSELSLPSPSRSYLPLPPPTFFPLLYSLILLITIHFFKSNTSTYNFLKVISKIQRIHERLGTSKFKRNKKAFTLWYFLRNDMIVL